MESGLLSGGVLLLVFGSVGGVASIVGECTGVVVAPEMRVLWLLEKKGDQGVKVVQKRRCRRSVRVADMT